MASHNQVAATLLSFLLCLLLGIGRTGFVQAQDGDAAILNSEVTRLNNQSLLWGPYRPNLYFGLRPRIPKSLMAGLMWAKVDNFQDVQHNFRWTCEQNEGMAGYGWDEYDTRKGGIQTVHDAGNKIDMSTSFVKIPGGAHGGSWAVRVKGEPREDAPAGMETTVVFYASTEGLGHILEVSGEGEGDNTGFSGDVTLKGSSAGLGDYKLVVTKGTGDPPSSNHPISAERVGGKTVVNSMTVPEEHVWQGKALLFTQLKQSVDAIVETYGAENAPPPWQVYQVPNSPAEGNVQMIQKTFEGPFEFDILFSSASAGKDVTSEDLSREIKSTTESFNDKYSKIFAPQAPFKHDKYRKLGSSMLSNLAGGIGYFNGHHLVDRSYAPEYEEENEGFWEETEAARARKQEQLEGPYELFTSIPSRPFFPRGFLWDEGFHLIPIADWDMDLALEIVKSWYDLMDEDGWIAREQILGAEARSKVPEAFQVQYPHYANPPTLFFIVEKFLHQLQKEANGTQRAAKETLATQGIKLENAHVENTSLGLKYLKELYPLLRRQFYWFKKTQYGDIRSYDREAHSSREAYRWRGRTVSHILTSGLDDYPRPQPPHPGELHVDLMSWVGLMAKTLSTLAQAIGEVDDAKDYEAVLDNIQHNLVDLHWSEKEGCFCDATIDDFEEHQLVCHKGYISLFPFLVGLLKPDDPHLGKTLDLLGNEEELFSPHGIRSLTKSSPLYGTEENYWRSPVWMPLNYLALLQLQHVALQNGPYQSKAADLYTRLRKNLVETVYQSWEETGFAWEQYNPETGKGQRTQHFTGWTSLVVKIMAMPDLSDLATSSAAPEPEKSSEGHDEL